LSLQAYEFVQNANPVSITQPHVSYGAGNILSVDTSLIMDEATFRIYGIPSNAYLNCFLEFTVEVINEPPSKPSWDTLY